MAHVNERYLVDEKGERVAVVVDIEEYRNILADLEELDFPAPIGRLEAFVTSGGLSTAPWTCNRTCPAARPSRYAR